MPCMDSLRYHDHDYDMILFSLMMMMMRMMLVAEIVLLKVQAKVEALS